VRETDRVIEEERERERERTFNAFYPEEYLNYCGSKQIHEMSLVQWFSTILGSGILVSISSTFYERILR